MRKDKIVYFVSFDTTLDSGQFITQWESYTSSVSSNADVVLQQSERNGKFKYLSQHYCNAGEFQFLITKAVRVFRQTQVEVKTRQMGGYTISQLQRASDTQQRESKVFVFITDPQTDITIYKKLTAKIALNIYEGYYENCDFAYILEFFTKSKDIDQLLAQLKECNEIHPEIYKECFLKVA
jgi:hypothetical protein